MNNVRIIGGDCEFFSFPGGERHVRIKSPLPLATVPKLKIDVEAHLTCSEDILDLLLLVNAIKHSGSIVGNLYVPYMPYARQDRINVHGEPLSIQVMADLINSVGADQVVINDPHSDVTPVLIENVRVVAQHNLIPINYEKRFFILECFLRDFALFNSNF